MADVVARGLRFHVQRIASSAPASAAPRPTVVFLHGLVMDNLSSFYFTVAQPMAAVADVVLYDLRGHGMSERPKSGYGLDEMVSDLEGVLDGVGVRDVVLVGNSFGGLLALAFAVRSPARVKGIVSIDGHLGETGWADRMAETLALEGDARDRKIAESFRSWLGRHSERKSTRLAKNASALVYDTTLVDDMRASAPLEPEALSAIVCPVLAIYGESSDLRAHAEVLARGLARCDLRILPGCTHSVLWEATSRVTADAIAFVRDLGSAA